VRPCPPSPAPRTFQMRCPRHPIRHTGRISTHPHTHTHTHIYNRDTHITHPHSHDHSHSYTHTSISALTQRCDLRTLVFRAEAESFCSFEAFESSCNREKNLDL
jgi:hypothetical protein